MIPGKNWSRLRLGRRALVASRQLGLFSRRARSQHITLREVASLAAPIAAGLLGDAGMGLVDAKLVGALGPSALGGVGLGLTLMYLFYAAVFGLMRGVKVRTAFAVGRGTPEDGRVHARAGVCLGMLLGIVVAILGRDVGWAFELLGVGADLRTEGTKFFAAVSWGAPGAFVMSALVQHRQGVGDTKTPMIIGIGGNIVNALLAYGLIHGHFSLPALGVRGAGFATAATQIGQAVVLFVLFLKSPTHARSKLTFREALGEICSIGVPTGLQFAAEMLAFAAFSAILGGLGAVEIAAHQVALAIIRVSFLPGIALGEAASVLVGQALGRQRLAEADQAVRACLFLAVGFMGVCGAIFAVLGGAIASVFTDAPEVARVATHLLWVAAAFQVLDAVNIVLRGALRGAKDVRAVALLGIGIVWTCVPTAALLLGRFGGLGAVGGWLGFISETTLASVLFLRRWKHASWRANYGALASEAGGVRVRCVQRSGDEMR